MAEVPTNDVLKCIYTLLKADSTLTSLGNTAVYTRDGGSESNTYPYIQVTFNANGNHGYTLGNRKARTVHLVAVKVVTTGNEPEARAIRDRVSVVLASGVPSVSAGSVYVLRRYSGFDFTQHDGSTYYHHTGDVYRVETT